MRKRGTQRIMSWLLAFVMMWQLSGLWELRVHAENGTEMSVEERLEEEAASPAIDCEETGRREESVKHFRLEDGSYLAVSYGVPVHYRENGEWKNISRTSPSADPITSSSLSASIGPVPAELHASVGGTTVLRGSINLKEVYTSIKQTVTNTCLSLASRLKGWALGK